MTFETTRPFVIGSTELDDPRFIAMTILTEGTVYYDGIPTNKINLDDLRSNITVVRDSFPSYGSPSQDADKIRLCEG